MSAASASQTPLRTLLSGPMAARSAARRCRRRRAARTHLRRHGRRPSTPAIIDGLPSGSNETKLEGLPIQMSVVDIHVIGAGGIGRLGGRVMRVGPNRPFRSRSVCWAWRRGTDRLRREPRARPARRPAFGQRDDADRDAARRHSARWADVRHDGRSDGAASSISSMPRWPTRSHHHHRRVARFRSSRSAAPVSRQRRWPKSCGSARSSSSPSGAFSAWGMLQTTFATTSRRRSTASGTRWSSGRWRSLRAPAAATTI